MSPSADIDDACQRLFLEPVELRWHRPGEQASECHAAVPLLGGAASAMAVAVWRIGSVISRSVLTIPAFRDWMADLPAEEQAVCMRFLENWRRPRQFPGLIGGEPAIMGVLNLTHDSFFGESRSPDPASAAQRFACFASQGAGILDIGAQSSRPQNRDKLPPAREWRVLQPVLEQAHAAGLTVSVDTIEPAVAAEAAAAGAAIINDVSGLVPPEAIGRSAILIGDMRGTPVTMQQWPRTRFGVFDSYLRLERQVAACLRHGVPYDRIAVDPGFGFGKIVTQNQLSVHHLPLFLGLGVAVAIGVSRKKSVGIFGGARRVADRLPASLDFARAAVLRGANIVRTHDVAATRAMLRETGRLGCAPRR